MIFLCLPEQGRIGTGHEDGLHLCAALRDIIASVQTAHTLPTYLWEKEAIHTLNKGHHGATYHMAVLKGLSECPQNPSM